MAPIENGMTAYRTGSGMPRLPVVASLTALPLEVDSRAFRIACTLAEKGFRSIVVEGKASRNHFWSDLIEVCSLSGPEAEQRGAKPRGGALRSGRFGRGGELGLYAAFRARELWRYHSRQALIPRADLYYLHSFELYLAVADRGVPIVYDAHDFHRGIEPPERLPSFDRNCLRPYLNRLEDRLVNAATALVTVSGGVANLMEATFKRRPMVIRNCHDERLDRVIEPDLRARLRLTPADRLCVVVGNRKHGMALDLAVTALSMLPDNFHLAFVGRFYEADQHRLCRHSAVARLHLGHWVAPDEVVPFIRTADLGLVLYEDYSANYRAALPNGFFQVVAAGLPMVRAALPEIERTIGDRAIGIRLDRLDAATLARAILDCTAGAPRFRAETAILAAELSWEKEARRLRGLVEELVGGPVWSEGRM